MPLCGIVPFLLILGVCCAAATALLFVTPTGSDIVGCGAQNAPCASLAAAVARANSLPDDDVMIQLAAGAYGPSSCNATAMRSMRIVGSGSAVTVIDCAFTSRLLYVPHDSNITVMGISVRRGFASAASPGGLFGGCVFVDWLAPINATVAPSAVFIDVNFSNCKVDTSSDAYWAGGGGLAVIFANDIWNTNQSGTFLSSSILIRNCTFSHNYVRQGTAWTVVGGGAMVGANSGGVVVDLALTISDTEFTNNQLTSALYTEGGGLGIALDGYMVNSTVTLLNLLLAFNTADYGGGMYIEHDGEYFSGQVTLKDSIAAYNTVSADGGGVFVEYIYGMVDGGYLHVSHCHILNNTAGGNGAGIFIYGALSERIPDTLQVAMYPLWEYRSEALIEDSTVQGNRATGEASCGGGLDAVNGGMVTLIRTSVVDNYATLYGGGVYVGPVSVSLNFGGGVVIENNTAVMATGAQISVMDGGNLTWSGVRVGMAVGTSQLTVQRSGYVAMDGSEFVCPPGSLFVDGGRGLFGDRAVLTSEPGTYAPIYTSTLEFGCEACPPGLYVLEGGTSNGMPLQADNPVCATCPYGGSCPDGLSITAVQGFWGAPVLTGATSSGRPSHTVQFAVCPRGYCCSTEAGGTPCSGIAVCGGNRAGRLCGECLPGYSESLASTNCRPDSDCTDGVWFWVAYGVGVMLEGGFLLMVSELWCSRRRRQPNDKPRLVSYFYQMIPSVVISSPKSASNSNWQNVLESILTVIRFQFPDSVSHRGACVVRGMGVTFKLSFGYLNPGLVACAMVLCYVAGLLLMRLCWCKCMARLAARVTPAEEKPEALNSPYQPQRSVDGMDAGGSRDTSEHGEVKVVAVKGDHHDLDVDGAAVRYSVGGGATSPLSLAVAGGEGDDFGITPRDPSRPMIDKTKGAALTWFLFGYSSILSTTLTLLSCVQVPGESGTYLFRGATVACTQTWRGPLVFVTVVLFLFAACLPLLAYTVKRAHTRADRKGRPDSMYRTLCEPFHDKVYWWEAVLVTQRLLMACLDTFLAQFPVFRLIFACFLSLFCTVAHILVSPMTLASTQRLQTSLQICLLVVTVCYIPQAQVTEQAAPGVLASSRAESLSASFLLAVQVAFMYVVPLISVILCAPKSVWANPFAQLLSRCGSF